MAKKFITAEQKERANNRLVLNFGILLAGALVMLYVYNFTKAGYPVEVKKVLGILGIVFAAVTVVMFVIGLIKKSRLKNYSAIPFGAFLSCAIISYFHKIPFLTKKWPAFRIEDGVTVILILMVAYFVILAVVTGIYLATHSVYVEKKQVMHKKKRK